METREQQQMRGGLSWHDRTGAEKRSSKERGRAGYLALFLLLVLALLASCGDPGAPKKATHPKTPHAHVEQPDPNGWLRETSLPSHRLVLYYGNPYVAVMGPIGRYSDDELLTRLREQAKAYADLDPAHPVVPGLDYVTPVAQGSRGDGTWIARMPLDSIEHYQRLANDHHMLFFFDMQIGHSTVQREVNNLWRFLQMPGVDLALDPEFDMPPGTVPGREFGRMTAAEINWVINRLSQAVLTQHLPTKILIIHQFRISMLPDWQKIKLQPGVEVVTCVDGFGSPEQKIDDYRIFDQQQLIQYPGMKLFYNLDKPLMTPKQTLALKPSPLMVMYQ